MIRRILFSGSISGSTLLPIDFENHDKISPDIKTAKDFKTHLEDKETGMDRLKMMFSLEYVPIRH